MTLEPPFMILKMILTEPFFLVNKTGVFCFPKQHRSHLKKYCGDTSDTRLSYPELIFIINLLNLY